MSIVPLRLFGHLLAISPFKKKADFNHLAASFSLFPNRILRVKGNASTEIKRSLLEFSFMESVFSEDELTIEIRRHEYTKDYINLTKEFYLKM